MSRKLDPSVPGSEVIPCTPRLGALLDPALPLVTVSTKLDPHPMYDRSSLQRSEGDHPARRRVGLLFIYYRPLAWKIPILSLHSPGMMVMAPILFSWYGRIPPFVPWLISRPVCAQDSRQRSVARSYRSDTTTSTIRRIRLRLSKPVCEEDFTRMPGR
jgi:hypothetical protein